MKTSEQTGTVGLDFTYYQTVKGQGRRWLVIDKFNGAVVDWGIRSNMEYLASLLNRNKQLQEVR